jgi:serine protease Do
VTPQGPAARAGVAPGDVIVRWDGTTVDEHASLPALVAATPVGRTVEMEALRDGAKQTFSITVDKMAEEPVAESDEATTPSRARFGMGLQDLSPADRKQLGLDDDRGVGITQVTPNSPADRAGLEPGDVILEVNRHPVSTVESVRQEAGKTTTLLLLVKDQDGTTRFVALRA